MRDLLENPVWLNATLNRKYQRLFGAISGFFLAVALISLFDGLIAQMRQGANELEFLPGEAITVSGPAVLKNPLRSDMIARFTPGDAPFRFQLEGFFTGYWFGNGMWRGQIVAEEAGSPGQYELRISFRGAPAQTMQKYELRIYADQKARHAGALSFIQRLTGTNPFMLATGTGIIGIFCGLVTYWFGRRFGNLLTQLGLSEVYSSDAASSSLWCLSPVPFRAGLPRMVLDADGHILGEARTAGWKKGKLQLTLMDERGIPPGALVCLRHPEQDNT